MVLLVSVVEYCYCIVFQLVLDYSRSSSFKQYHVKWKICSDYCVYARMCDQVYRTLFIFLWFYDDEIINADK